MKYLLNNEKSLSQMNFCSEKEQNIILQISTETMYGLLFYIFIFLGE